MKHCETCRREWPEGYQHAGVFARLPGEPHPDEMDIDALVEEQSRLTSFARIVFHAIYCVWKEGDEEIFLADIDDLTMLGQALCWEIGRYEQRILAAVPTTEDPPAKRTRGCGEGRASS